MAQQIKVNAELRECSGSSAARRYRRAGIVPAILNKEDRSSTKLSLNAHDFERMLSRHVSEHLLVTVCVGGAETLALIHEVQRDGLTGRVIHADFGEVDRTKKMRIELPLVFLGEPIGVTRDGGILEIGVHSVEVECLPENVVEDFTVQVGELGLDDQIHVRDLAIGPEFQVLTHADLTVASVRAPAAAPAAEEAAPAAEGDAAAAPAAPAADAKAAPAPAAKPAKK